MRAVAERLAAGCPAGAEPQPLGLLGGEQHRGEPGALVRAVTKRLRAAAPASAPEVALAFLDGDIIGRLLRRDRLVHLSSLASPLLLSAYIGRNVDLGDRGLLHKRLRSGAQQHRRPSSTEEG